MLTRRRLAARRYVLLLLLCLAAVWCTLIPLSFYKDPYTGDLTRLGGYLENDYGWRRSQAYFSPPLVSGGKLDRSYDIVVLGDSFSDAEFDIEWKNGQLWTNHLHALTGLRIGLFHVNAYSVEDIVDSPGFRNERPLAFIWERVERDVVSTLSGTDCRLAQPYRPTAPAAAQAFDAPRKQFDRPTGGSLNDELTGQAVNYLYKSVYRALPVKWDGGVTHHPLTQADLFSSRRSADILTYSGDLALRGTSERAMDAAACRLSEFQLLVESQGVSFTALIAPDKTSAYRSYINDPRLHAIDLEGRLTGQHGLNILRIRPLIDQLIADGRPDVYLPNDTHWGSDTHRSVAVAAILHLRDRGILSGSQLSNLDPMKMGN